MNDDQVRAYIGPAKQAPVIRLDHGLPDSNVPNYTVGGASFDADGPVKIIDFGGAWRFGERPEKVHIYPIYRPPELIGEGGQLTNDTGLDLWMLGCTVRKCTSVSNIAQLIFDQMFRIFTGGSLFDEWRDDHLRAQIDTITNNNQMKPEEALYLRISENESEIAEHDRGQLARVLGGLIVKDPEQRHSALMLDQGPWLQD
jgi:serine/threonine protein kinase